MTRKVAIGDPFFGKKKERRFGFLHFFENSCTKYFFRQEKAMSKIIIKIKKEDLPKKRIPIPPPSRRHKSKKDYDRKKNKEILIKEIKGE